MEHSTMSIDRIGRAFITALALGVMGSAAAAQQWNGASGPNGTIWRPGNVMLGIEAAGGGTTGALLQIRRPLSSSPELLFSAVGTFQAATGHILEIDTTRAYVGGARDKASLLHAGTFDLGVNRGVAIGLANIVERIPSGYMLAVGGKVLAEEVRIKPVKDWADHVLRSDYPLQSLPDVEAFIRNHHHLPGVPSAAEVTAAGVSLGDMQSRLLAKIEELTLHMIEQHKTIATLQQKLAELKNDRDLRSSNASR
jgi:hypothetical protein